MLEGIKNETGGFDKRLGHAKYAPALMFEEAIHLYLELSVLLIDRNGKK